MVSRNRKRSKYDYRYKGKQKTGFLENLSITSWIIIVTSIISVVSFVLFALDERFIDLVALNPSVFLQGKALWTIVLHMFVHGGIGHLLVNMFVLFSLGGLCEKIIGRKRYIWFYFISGICAALLAVLLAGFFGTGLGERVFGSANVAMVGASGAIFALAGLLMVLLPNLRFSIIFVPFFSLKAYVMIPLVLFLTWGLSIWFNWPIGNVAHFGGFLAGIIYGGYLRKRYRNKVRNLQRYFK